MAKKFVDGSGLKHFYDNYVPKVGNKLLPSVAISCAWTVYKNDGTEAKQGQDIPALVANASITIERGFKAKFTGTYKWTHADGKKDPTKVVSASPWNTTLPASGVASASASGEIVSANTTYKVVLGAAKTGLMVVGTSVENASGDDTVQDSKSVTFQSRRFFGVTTSASVTEAVLKALAGSELTGGKASTKSGVTATETQYYVYAYPKDLGELSTIIQDGATPVLGAFTKSEVSVTNAAGLAITYLVYRSNNPGAFTGASLEFK